MSRRFDKVLDSATDQTLVEPNWESILECVDMIRGSDVSVKQALSSIQRRCHSENPHVAHHALLVLEACVKNCGKKFHDEIATKDFMDDLKNIVIDGAPEKVKNKVLELIHCWSLVFERISQYKIVCDTHLFMKMYGYEFPKVRETDAMFMADSAPEWADGDNCFRCRAEFGVFTRKHHCRSCGQIFCDRCSNRQMFLPRFGIEKKVRVCETCYGKSNEASAQKSTDKTPQNTHRSSDQDATSSAAAEEARQRELKEKEEEELQLALAISMSEQEAKENGHKSNLYHQFGNSDSGNNLKNETNRVNGSNDSSNRASTDYMCVYRGVATDSSVPAAEEEEEIDPALSRYLDKRYWEQRQAARDAESMVKLASTNIKATAPPPSEMSFSTSSGEPNVNDYLYYTSVNGVRSAQAPVSATPNGVTNGYGPINNIEQKMSGISLNTDDEVDQTIAFCKNLHEQVEIMDNRMRSNLMRGRSVVNDSAIHSLFAQLTKNHSEVLTRMSKLDTDREHYEGLQDHLAYIQEARQALTALREEHSKQRQERLLEEQRLRSEQMQSKVKQIRHKRYESLLEQQHIALKQLQNEELRLQQNRGQVQQQQPSPPMQQQPAVLNMPQGYSPSNQQQAYPLHHQPNFPAQPQMPVFPPQGHQVFVPQHPNAQFPQHPGYPPQQYQGYPPQQQVGFPSHSAFLPQQHPGVQYALQQPYAPPGLPDVQSSVQPDLHALPEQQQSKAPVEEEPLIKFD